jgi:16S rRNA (uracil1498-N3)-methyltransferase
MHRFFLKADQFSGKEVVFPPELAHQILHVLRLGEGDRVAVLDNQGQVHRVELHAAPGGRYVTGTIRETEPVTNEPGVHVSLCFGLSTRDKVEGILQKGTEIGVSAFYPFVSTRTRVQSTGLTAKKFARWERIIREAAEQSHRGRLPVLNPPLDFERCLAEVTQGHGLSLIASVKADLAGLPLRQRLASFAGKTIALLVGPEGGFSEDEIGQAIQSGCQVVSLGERVLRMETAAMVLPALVLHHLGEL